MHLIENECTLFEKMLTFGNRRIDCLEIIIERLDEQCFHLSCFMILPFKQNANSTFAFEFCTQNNKCKAFVLSILCHSQKTCLNLRIYQRIVVHSRFFSFSHKFGVICFKSKILCVFLTFKFLICY